MPEPSDWAQCRRDLAIHSKSFDLAARIYERTQRDEVAALYAWCRYCDDAVDLAPAGERRGALDRLQAELASVYRGEPQNTPVLACFQAVVERRRIPVEYAEELLAGMSMDVGEVIYERVGDLLVYCWRVAGTVGLMMCHVMGVSQGRAALHAAHLGIGMQLTNICRDVVEDWERGRVYLPLDLLSHELSDWLREHVARSPRPPLPHRARAEMAMAVTQLLRRADRYYASADQGLAFLEPRAALAVRAARLVYAEIGRRIERGGCDVMRGRAVVPSSSKLRLLGRAAFRFAADRHAWDGRSLTVPEDIVHAADAIRLA